MNVQSLVVNAFGTCTDETPGALGRRLLVIAAGMVVLSYGRRSSRASRAIGALGAALVARALAGCDDIARVRAWLASRPTRLGDRLRPDPGDASHDEVDEIVEQSFPASDPPSWSAAVASAVTSRNP